MEKRFIAHVGDLTLKPIAGEREIRFRPVPDRAMNRPREDRHV